MITILISNKYLSDTYNSSKKKMFYRDKVNKFFCNKFTLFEL